MRKIEKGKVIAGFKTNYGNAWLSACVALIIIGKHEEKEYKQFMTYCQYKEGINYYVRQMGKYDLELTIDAKNTNEFYEIMDEIRNRFSFIKKITTLITK